MKCQNLFSGKKNKESYIINLSPAEETKKVVRVKCHKQKHLGSISSKDPDQ